MSAPDTRRGRTFVGFGFGAIQAGLFLAEAQASGAFERLVVAEVLPEVVTTLRAAGGYFTVNVAHADRIEALRVGPVEVFDPAVEPDRAALMEAIAAAHEMATAVPSVQHYAGAGPGSIHRLLADGLTAKLTMGGPPAVLYAAENHNHAAELLRDHVAGVLEEPEPLARVCFANTVIGKMSGAPALDTTAPGQALEPMTPGSVRTFLVEAFNHILVSPALLPSGQRVERGIQVFLEKPDLLPFEEAKLYVHNALHATAGYLGAMLGLETMAELPEHEALLAVTRRAALEESGAALVIKHAGVDDLFTDAGMAAYVDDLIARMTNPFLNDRITRVGRDPQRKLAWDDRLIGAMRVAQAAGIRPRRLALGAAAALAQMAPGESAAAVVPALWRRPVEDAEEVALICARVEAAQVALLAWRAAGFPPLDPFAETSIPALLSDTDSIRTPQ